MCAYYFPIHFIFQNTVTSHYQKWSKKGQPGSSATCCLPIQASTHSLRTNSQDGMERLDIGPPEKILFWVFLNKCLPILQFWCYKNGVMWSPTDWQNFANRGREVNLEVLYGLVCYIIGTLFSSANIYRHFLFLLSGL